MVAVEGIPRGAAHQVGFFFVEVLQVCGDGFVGGGKDGVVAACRQQLAHGALASQGDGRELQQPHIFRIGSVLFQVTHHAVGSENVPCRCVDILSTTA